MARRYVSNNNETVRIFDSGLLEFFSHVHPATPLVIYLPVIGYMLYLALVTGRQGSLAVAGLFLFGTAIWTLAEYTLHRCVFHYQPQSLWGKRLHFLVHGVHHDYPNDASRLVMPPVVSIPLALLFYGLFLLSFHRHMPAAFAGFIFGYLCYDMIHYATHHFSLRRGIWLRLKQYHMLHHYRDDDRGYGVSTPIWDYVFGTVPEREA